MVEEILNKKIRSFLSLRQILLYINEVHGCLRLVSDPEDSKTEIIQKKSNKKRKIKDYTRPIKSNVLIS